MIGHDSLVKLHFIHTIWYGIWYFGKAMHRLSKLLATISSANFGRNSLDKRYLLTHTKSKYSGKAKRVEDTQGRFLEEN